jgi:hypothetical protein
MQKRRRRLKNAKVIHLFISGFCETPKGSV